MSATDDYEKRIGDRIFGTTESGFTSDPNGTIYLALHTGEPEDGGASECATANAYARVDVSSSGSPKFTYDAGEGGWDNDAEIAFPEATGSWGTVTHAALWTASTGGMCICWTTCGSNEVGDNQTVKFAAGALNFTVS